VKLFSPRLKTFTPGVAAAPGVTPVALAGHTPGHVGYEIVWGQNRLMDIGDSAHSAIVSLARPGWANGFDTDPVAGRASRLATLALLAHSHELVFAPHFPFPGVGRIEKAGDGYVWKPGLP
jgi:glyoxylase-like metal-dependent hydrolase (beta-lactamase superfamily II)